MIVSVVSMHVKDMHREPVQSPGARGRRMPHVLIAKDLAVD